MARPRRGEEKHAKKGIALRVPDWVRAGLDRTAKERNAALTDVVSEAIVAYLARQGIKPAPIVPNAKTITAMKEARKGGLRSHRNAKALLKSLNEDD